MKFRHEWKHEINKGDYYELRGRLSSIAYPDKNGINGRYIVRSLYFDDLNDTALMEKINGVSKREKFRIRYYDYDKSFIHLEKKAKIDKLCCKTSEVLSEEQVNKILDGDIQWMLDCEKPLIRELYYKIKNNGIKPKTIVEYTRDAFTFPAGNVRVTLDYNIRTGLGSTDFLNPNCITIPAGNPVVILEVKWDEFLPDVIKDAVQLKDRRVSAFSKYAACRIYD